MSEGRKYDVVPASSIPKNTRKPPSQIMLESLDGEYKTMKEMAEHVGVHIETLRRLCRSKDENGNPRIKAPSDAVVSGKMTIYLFNEEDVAEVEAYFRRKGFAL